MLQSGYKQSQVKYHFSLRYVFSLQYHVVMQSCIMISRILYAYGNSRF